MTGDSYSQKQEVLDRQYREEYRKWSESLSDRERMEMDSTDPSLLEPLTETRGVGAPELDESRLVSNGGSPDELVIADEEAKGAVFRKENTVADFPAEKRVLQDAVRNVVAIIFESKKPNLTAGVIGAALQAPGCTVKVIAKRHRIRQSDVEKMVEGVRERIGDLDDFRDRVALRNVLGEVAGHNCTGMSLEVLSLVSGICYRGHSETEIAKRHGKTRAAVSKRCVELCGRLGVPPSRAMKSEASRAIYSEAQIEYHHNQKKNS